MKTNRLFKGLFSLTFFVLILFFIAFSASKNTKSNMFQCDEGTVACLRNIFTTPLAKDTPLATLYKNQVIEEESVVIDVTEKVSPAVVSIVVKTVGFDAFSGPYEMEDGIGTGFIVDSSGIIITNSHVVDNPSGEYSVVLKDGTAYEVEDIHLDPRSDLAIVEVTARDLPTVELGDSNTLKVGQIAIAIGNALGRFDNTVTVGVVSGIARELTAVSGFGTDPQIYENAIQTDAALNPGNSGGPLLNSSGQVIGINVATSQGAENIGFAIPVNTLKPILESYRQEGRIVRPYIGIGYSLITEDIAKLRRLPQGAFVSRVLPTSPAEKAGLQRGDIITKINNTVIGKENSVNSILVNSKVGEKLILEVDRGGEIRQMTLILEEAPKE